MTRTRHEEEKAMAAWRQYITRRRPDDGRKYRVIYENEIKGEH